MRFQPRQIAIEYYFGDFQYWKLPGIAVEALAEGYDGPALRKLASLSDPIEADMDLNQIDAAFRELGVAEAPITKDRARLSLAVQLARRVVDGSWDVFEAATHLRIHLCDLNHPPEELRDLWRLAEESKNAQRSHWSRLDQELNRAFSRFFRDFNQD